MVTIVVTADLHYNIPRSREPARRLAADACGSGGDALVLVGDTAGADTAPLRDGLRLFADFPGRKLLVPGNHCLWCRDGEDSLQRYERVLPEVAAEEGFALLDHEPVVLGDVGLVGSIGWYDYSFREESLGIPEPFYRAKVAPGAAEALPEHRQLVEAHRPQLDERQYALGARWMDGAHVRLPMSDEQFLARLCDTLERQMEHLARRAERIVAFVHHLPFRELVPRNRPDRFAFAAAFMGSERLGEVLLAQPKLTHVYCGHSHWPGRCRLGGVEVVNVGSTYRDKRLEILEL
jgi:predicted phosphohydrolase